MRPQDVIPDSRETVEEFLARGGKIRKLNYFEPKNVSYKTRWHYSEPVEPIFQKLKTKQAKKYLRTAENPAPRSATSDKTT